MTERRYSNYSAPAITPEQLYRQDKLTRKWDREDQEVLPAVAAYFRGRGEHDLADKCLRKLWR